MMTVETVYRCDYCAQVIYEGNMLTKTLMSSDWYDSLFSDSDIHFHPMCLRFFDELQKRTLEEAIHSFSQKLKEIKNSELG